MKFILENIFLIGIALVSGGLLLWPLLSRRSGSGSLGTLEATQLINARNAIVLDVREPAAFATGSITGARNMPLATLAERAGELARFKARPLLVVCETGTNSARALEILKKQEFAEVVSLAGGLAAWKQAGLPLVKSVKDQPRPVQKDAPKARQKGGSSQAKKAKPEISVEAAARESVGVPAAASADDSAKETV